MRKHISWWFVRPRTWRALPGRIDSESAHLTLSVRRSLPPIR